MCVCSMLATKLNMSTDDAERWIVNLIRNAKLDAKIDALEVCFVACYLFCGHVYVIFFTIILLCCLFYFPLRVM